MVTVSSLTKYFGEIKAVDNLSFEIKAGEILGLVGPNGAGKTTTLRCMCGILKPYSGSIIIDGHDLLTDDIAAKRLLAFIPEVPIQYDLLNVKEHLQFIAMCYNTMKEFETMKDEILDRYALREKENALVAELSKGMKQKLAIASALIHNASVFLCDEPLVGLDPQGQYSFKTELKNLRNKYCGILISTHQLETAEMLCDRLIIMQKGKKILSGLWMNCAFPLKCTHIVLKKYFFTLLMAKFHESIILFNNKKNKKRSLALVQNTSARNYDCFNNRLLSLCLYLFRFLKNQNTSACNRNLRN